MIMAMMLSGKMIAIIFVFVFTIQVGIMMMPLTNLNTVQAEDKSTSISCYGVECVRKLNVSMGSVIPVRQILQKSSIAHHHRCQEQTMEILRVRTTQLAHL
jgi:hypothetical protein